MNNKEKTLPSQDPELEALLKLLQETPERDPQVIGQGRARYIAEVNEIFASETSSSPSWLNKFLTLGVFNTKRGQSTERRSMKFSYSIVVAALVIALFLLSGAGITAFAAQSALPGDALYNLKTSIEQAQVRLAADAAKIAELHLEFAERRLDEISGLIAEGRYGDIDRATQEFEYHVQQALQAMETVAAGDPLRAQQLAARVTAALSEYARSLAEMMMNVPDTTRASMQRAIEASRSPGPLAPGEFGENENEASNENINDDQGNFNGADNQNSDDDNNQTNQNGGIIHDNEDENENENDNVNSNEDDDDNENQSNRNSNSNLNDRDNSNENDSDNENDDDNNNKDNDNDHDNDNDNDNEHNDNDGGED